MALPPHWESALQQVVEGTLPCKTLRIHYIDGDPVLGQTAIYMQGGYVRVVRTPSSGGQSQVYRGRIGNTGCVRLARSLVRFRFTKRRFRKAPLRHEETRPSLKLRFMDLPTVRVQHRGFDVQNDPAFAVLRGELLRVAYLLSDGQVRW